MIDTTMACIHIGVVHVLRSHNLEDFEHPGALRDLREDRTVHAWANMYIYIYIHIHIHIDSVYHRMI